MFSSQIIFSSGKSCAACIVLTSRDPELCNWWANNKTICNVPSAVSSMMEWRKIDSSIFSSSDNNLWILYRCTICRLFAWRIEIIKVVYETEISMKYLWNIYEAHLIFWRSSVKTKRHSKDPSTITSHQYYFPYSTY